MIYKYSAACGLLGGLRRNSFKGKEVIDIERQTPEAVRILLKKYLKSDYPSEEKIHYIERALNISFLKKAAKLIKFLDTEAKEVVKTLVSEFDMFNLKLLIRRIHLNTNEGDDMFYWGFAPLVFKDKNPCDFRDIEELRLYLRRKPILYCAFNRAFENFRFHRDIFYFDFCLDEEYLALLKYTSSSLDYNSRRLLENFISIRVLTFALRLKFFQGRDYEEVRTLLGRHRLLNRGVLSQIMNVSSLEEAIAIIEKNPLFSKLRLRFSLNFEEDLDNVFYKQFLKKRGVNFFSMYPYLVFYLSQRYLIEKLVFIVNDRFK